MQSVIQDNLTEQVVERAEPAIQTALQVVSSKEDKEDDGVTSLHVKEVVFKESLVDSPSAENDKLANDSLKAAQAEAAENGGPSDTEDSYWSLIRSLFAPLPRNPVRQSLVALTDSKGWARFFIWLILINCVVLAMADPTQDESSKWNSRLRVVELLLTILFTVESVIMSLAHTLILGPHAYLLSPWHKFDVLILLSSWLEFIPGVTDLSFLRTLRVLKSLRTINRKPTLRLLVVTLLRSLPLLADVIVCLIFIIAVFAIVGTQLFGGRLSGVCQYGFDLSRLPADLLWDNTSTTTRTDQLNALAQNLLFNARLQGYSGSSREALTWLQGVEVCDLNSQGLNRYGLEGLQCGDHLPSVFQNMDSLQDWMREEGVNSTCVETESNPLGGFFHFDSFPWSCLAVWQVFTLSNWDAGLSLCINAVGELQANTFFYLCVIVGAFFSFQLTAAVLTAKFQQSSADSGQLGRKVELVKNHALSTSEALMGMMSRAFTMSESNNPVKRWFLSLRPRCRMIVESFAFRRTYVVITCMNMVTLSLQHASASDLLRSTLLILHLAFTLLYSLELVLHCLALGLRNYIKQLLNVIDGGTTVLAVIEAGLMGVSVWWGEPVRGDLEGALFVLYLMHPLRVLRSIRIIRMNKAIRGLFQVVKIGIVALSDFCLLLGLFIFIAMILGMQTFGQYEVPSNPRRTFHSLGYSFLTVFEILTGNDWDNTMRSYMDDSTEWAALYFVVVGIVGDLILLNLCMAILIDAIKKGQEGEFSGSVLVTEQELLECPLLASCQAESLDMILPLLRPIIRCEGDCLACEGSEVTAMYYVLYGTLHLQDEEFNTLHTFRRGDWLGADTMMEKNAMWKGSVVVVSSSACLLKLTHYNFMGLLRRNPRAFLDNPLLKDRAQDLIHSSSESASVMVHKMKEWLESIDMSSSLMDEISELIVKSKASIASRIDSVLFRGSLTSKGKKNSLDFTSLPSGSNNRYSTEKEREQSVRGGKDKGSPRGCFPGNIALSLLMEAEEHLTSHAVDTSSKSCSISDEGRELIFAKKTSVEENTDDPGSSTAVRGQRNSTEKLKAFRQLASLSMRAKNMRLGKNGAGKADMELAKRTASVEAARRHSSLSSKVEDDLDLGFELEDEVDGVKEAEGMMSDDEVRKLKTFEISRSLYLFSADSRFRHVIIKTVNHPFFEAFITINVLISSVSLALDRPGLDPHSNLAHVIKVLDFIFAIVFLSELVLKVIAQGFVMHKGSYLRSGWNQLDAFIVIASLPSLLELPMSQSFKSLRALRVVRALRPLRTVSRLSGIKMVVETLFQGLMKMKPVMLVGLFVFYVFALAGVSVFGGNFKTCTDSSVLYRKECTGWVVAPDGASQYQRMLTNHVYNFDNVGNALLTLFTIGTKNKWTDIMWMAMDLDFDRQLPNRENSPFSAVYFVIFVIISSFLWVNVMVSVVVDTYEKIMGQSDARRLKISLGEWYTEIRERVSEQEKAEELAKQNGLDKKNSTPPWRKPLLAFFETQILQRFIVAIICLNMVVIATYHAHQTEIWWKVQTFSGHVFTCIYVVEMLFICITITPSVYFRDRWYQLDFFVVAVSLVQYLMNGDPQIIALLKVFRLFKIVNRVRGLKLMVKTLAMSMTAMLNVAAVLVLILFVFAIQAMHFFGHIQPGAPGVSVYINGRSNYRTFARAASTLITVLTGSAFYDQLEATFRQCDEIPACAIAPSTQLSHLDLCDDVILPSDYHTVVERSCSHDHIAPVFFVLFFSIENYLVLSIFVAAMLSRFCDVCVDDALLSTRNVFNELLRYMIRIRVSQCVRAKIKTYRALIHDASDATQHQSQKTFFETLGIDW